MPKTLAAFTPAAPASYPPYINISLNDDDQVEITVRSAPDPDGKCGVSAMIALPIGEFAKLLMDADNASFFRPAA